MRVVNHHKRIICQPKTKVSQLFDTLGLANDKIWPYENWPAIKFKDGLKVGSKGGHGRISYTIIAFSPGDSIKFKFSKPDGFNGTHELKINSLTDDTTEIVHEINVNTSFKAAFFWLFIIRWLHDALIEEAFDKVENQFLIKKNETPYNFWVKLLRNSYKRTSFKTKHA